MNSGVLASQDRLFLNLRTLSAGTWPGNIYIFVFFNCLKRLMDYGIGSGYWRT